MTIIMALALEALTCAGSGFVQHEGPPKNESQSGMRWLDDFNNTHDGFTAEVLLDDSAAFRIKMPRQILDSPDHVSMTVLMDDGRNVKAARSMGPRRYIVLYDRQEKHVAIEAPNGVFTATCRAS